jgi:hypothetical protein
MHDDSALPASGSCTGSAAIPCRVIHRLPLLECIGLLTAEEQTEGGVTLPLFPTRPRSRRPLPLPSKVARDLSRTAGRESPVAERG